MSSTPVNPLTQLALSSLPQTRTTSGTFFAALAEAWKNALDKQALVIQEKSAELNQEGNDTPGAITQLSAEAGRFTFMASSSHTSLSSAVEGLKAVAQK
jgi:hypothetical protein